MSFVIADHALIRDQRPLLELACTNSYVYQAVEFVFSNAAL